MANTTGQVMPDGTVQYYEDAMGRAMVSTDYDPTSSYAVGDYCIYDNVRYCCNTAIGSGGETWNSAHWDVAKVDDDVTEIKQSLSQIASVTTYNQSFYKPGKSGSTDIQNPSRLIVNSTLKIAALHYYGSDSGAMSVGNTYQLGTLESVATPQQLVVVPINRDNGGNTIGQLFIDTDRKVYIKPLVSMPSGVVFRAYAMFFII